MKKILTMIALASLCTLGSYALNQGHVLEVKKEKKDDKKAQMPDAPKEPSFKLIDVPLVNYVLISESDWKALERYFDAFDQYAEDADRELAKIKKLKKDKKRPQAPRLSLNSVASNELPALLRASKDSYLSISHSDRQILENNLKEMREYIAEVQRLFNSNTK